MRRRWAILLVWAAAVVPAAGLIAADVSAATTGNVTTVTSPAKSENLLFSYFKGNGEDGLHLAWSDDGLHWQALKNDQPFLVPQVGKEKLIRDPSILRGPDGVYHMVWTCSWEDHGIGYADSKDLIHWSAERFLPLMENEPTARNCWAPELFYDEAGAQFLIVWATTIPGKYPETDGQDANPRNNNPGYNHRLYYVTTKDFQTFSPAALFYNPGFNCIDPAIFQDDARYVLVFKDETNKPFPVQKNLKLAFADHAEGPYGAPTGPITGPAWAEGPTPMKIGDRWFIYFDEYTSHRYGLVVSTDLQKWTDISDQLVVPNGIRHGTVFHAPKEDIDALKKVE
jgi:hypothetical protein